MKYRNYKQKGENGQSIVIGELAKWGINVAIPLSDNLPFDLIIIYSNKLYKVQVKTSEREVRGTKGSICFKLTSNNWYNGTTKKYKPEEIDLMILCDLSSIFILSRSDFLGKTTFSIRKDMPLNCQKKKLHLASKYVISEERIKEIFE